MWKLRTTSGAALKFLLPSWWARTVQVPGFTRWTMPTRVTVQGPDTRWNFTTRPEDELADRLKSGSPNVLSTGCGKLIVWPDLSMTTGWLTVVAGNQSALPPWCAVTRQVFAWLKWTTPAVLTEHLPEDLANVTGRPELDVAPVTPESGSPQVRCGCAGKVIVWCPRRTLNDRATSGAAL